MFGEMANKIGVLAKKATGGGGGVSYQVINNSDGGATVGTGSIYID
jgi:hypothetical protein